MTEVKQIMDMLGRKQIEGQVRGTHLGQILDYLERTRTESLKTTLSKLALVCGMSKRNVRENYIEGISEFGIIQLMNIQHDVIWKWHGIKAFNGKEETFMEHVERKKKEEKEKKENGK